MESDDSDSQQERQDDDSSVPEEGGEEEADYQDEDDDEEEEEEEEEEEDFEFCYEFKPLYPEDANDSEASSSSMLSLSSAPSSRGGHQTWNELKGNKEEEAIDEDKKSELLQQQEEEIRRLREEVLRLRRQSAASTPINSPRGGTGGGGLIIPSSSKRVAYDEEEEEASPLSKSPQDFEREQQMEQFKMAFLSKYSAVQQNVDSFQNKMILDYYTSRLERRRNSVGPLLIFTPRQDTITASPPQLNNKLSPVSSKAKRKESRGKQKKKEKHKKKENKRKEKGKESETEETTPERHWRKGSVSSSSSTLQSLLSPGRSERSSSFRLLSASSETKTRKSSASPVPSSRQQQPTDNKEDTEEEKEEYHFPKQSMLERKLSRRSLVPRDDRITCVVIGDNNTGKTTLIKALCLIGNCCFGGGQITKYVPPIPTTSTKRKKSLLSTVGTLRRGASTTTMTTSTSATGGKEKEHGSALMTARDGNEGMRHTVKYSYKGRERVILFQDSLSISEAARMRMHAYAMADVCILCFACNDPSSMRSVQVNWIAELRNCKPNLPIILVSTKIDLRKKHSSKKKSGGNASSPLVLSPQAEKCAKAIRASALVECSVLQEQTLTELLHAVVKLTCKTGSGILSSYTSSSPSGSGIFESHRA
ncbi:hypothetical protein QOT17_001456 [Balamuthia mandrillaris]